MGNTCQAFCRACFNCLSVMWNCFTSVFGCNSCKRCRRKCLCCDSCAKCRFCNRCCDCDWSFENKKLIKRAQDRDKTYVNGEKKKINGHDSKGNHRTLRDVKLLNPMKSGATENFIMAFVQKLEEHGLNAVDTDVEIFNNDDTSNDVSIVICHNHSRIESNVTNALSKFKKEQYQRMFLVILHIKLPRDLPNQSSKDVLQENETFDKIYEIVDVAFSKTDGFYDCPMNKKAFAAIDHLARRK